jgi:hypothetical protein
MLCGVVCWPVVTRCQGDEDLAVRVTSNGLAALWGVDGHRLRGSVLELPPTRGPLSPDGSKVAYVEKEAVFVADRKGTESRRISPADVAAGRPCWSPDGRQLAFVGSKGKPQWQIYIADADGQNVRQLTQGAVGAWNPQFGSDGRLAYVEYAAPMEKYQKGALVVRDVRDPQKAEPAIVARGVYIGSFAWSPDAGTIAFATIGELIFHDLKTATERRVALTEIDPRLAGMGVWQIAWRPDGGAAACATQFVGDRRQGGPKLFGDEEVLIIPREGGKASVFSVGGAVERVQWTKLGGEAGAKGAPVAPIPAPRGAEPGNDR